MSRLTYSQSWRRSQDKLRLSTLAAIRMHRWLGVRPPELAFEDLVGNLFRTVHVDAERFAHENGMRGHTKHAKARLLQGSNLSFVDIELFQGLYSWTVRKYTSSEIGSSDLNQDSSMGFSILCGHQSCCFEVVDWSGPSKTCHYLGSTLVSLPLITCAFLEVMKRDDSNTKMQLWSSFAIVVP